MDITKIEKFITIKEIKNLRIRYAHYLDSNNIESVILLFSENAVCKTDRNPWRGRAEIKAGLEKAFADYDPPKLKKCWIFVQNIILPPTLN